MKYGFTFVVEKLNIEGIAYKIPIFDTSEDIKNMSTGKRLRHALEDLGPTFIKLGQIMSTRKDLFDQDIIDELSKLRDDTNKFPTEEAEKIFESELGSGVDEAFLEFNREPIAAASIGQVYEARLKSGEEVIVKVQRPNIEKIIKSDLHILRMVANTLKDVLKDFKLDMPSMVEEFETQILRELDYNFEAISAIKFKNIFKNSEEVYIPEVYMDLSTSKILVLEKINGIKLSDVDEINRRGWDANKIANIGIRSFFVQVLGAGFFHADPHPGNIFVIDKGKISYIDFGMIGIIDKKTLKLLNNISLAVVHRNVDKIIYYLTEIEAIPNDTNLTGFKQDMLYLMHFYYDVPLERLSMTEILNEVFRFFRKYGVVVPNQLIMLAKTIIILEGTARLIDPTFSIDSLGKEFLKHYYKDRLKFKDRIGDSIEEVDEVLLDLKSIPKQLKSILKNIEKNDIKLEIQDVKMTKLEKVLVEFTQQISLSLVLAALIIGSATIISSPNIASNYWVRLIAFIGFFTSFIVGLLLIIKSLRAKYKKD
jgi:ubiquinone biosynthesis protein